MRCPFPLAIKHDGEYLGVPCGKCATCLTNRIRGWSFRLEQELKYNPEYDMHFVTLTYSNENVPITPNGFLTLDKTHVQKFLKRLRKNFPPLEGAPYKYYAVGEYGKTFGRPHYHMILLGLDDKMSFGRFERTWGLGSVDVQIAGAGSIGYVCGYVNKGKVVPAHGNDDREKEFALMSKGVGKQYLSEAVVRYHASSIDRCFVTARGGAKMQMPRYYKDKIYSQADKEEIAQRMNSIDEVEKQKIEYFRQHGSLDNFWKDRYASLKAYNDNYFKSSKSKRKL